MFGAYRKIIAVKMVFVVFFWGGARTNLGYAAPNSPCATTCLDDDADDGDNDGGDAVVL